MSSPLASVIAASVSDAARATGLPIATVTAISSTTASLSVSLSGGTLTGLRWIKSGYTPTVGDLVVLVRTQEGWIVLGTLSASLTSGTVSYGTAAVLASPGWGGLLAEDYWTWALTTDSLPAGQGRRTVLDTIDEVHAGVWVLPVAAAVPSGGTVTAAKLRLTRWTPNAEESQSYPEADMVTPRVYLHAYTALPTAAPTWTSTVWAPGSLTVGQSASWDLPSAWLTALLAGTATGVGVYSATRTDWTRMTARVDLTYSTAA